jgi:hypothetical protein
MQFAKNGRKKGGGGKVFIEPLGGVEIFLMFVENLCVGTRPLTGLTKDT